MFYLLLTVGLTLSAAAAYFSVTGLAAIFAGAFYSVIVMGSSLEAAKLVITSWLYRRWDDIGKLMKSYLVIAVIILMGITSLGIFGYLSKAYLEQEAPNAQLQNQIVLIEQKLQQEQNDVERSNKQLSQLDSQIDKLVERGSVNRSNSLRNQQKIERQQIEKELTQSIKEIDSLNSKMFELKNQTATVEAKVGPIKYFAEMIQGEDVDIDKAVQMVILLLIFVFDPLAVATLIAANKEQMLRNTPKKGDEKVVENDEKSFENKENSAKIEEKVESFLKDEALISELRGKPTLEEINNDLNVETEEIPVESMSYDESKNRFTSIEKKSKMVESKVDDSFNYEEENESEYRFRHRKQ